LFQRIDIFVPTQTAEVFQSEIVPLLAQTRGVSTISCTTLQGGAEVECSVFFLPREGSWIIIEAAKHVVELCRFRDSTRARVVFRDEAVKGSRASMAHYLALKEDEDIPFLTFEANLLRLYGWGHALRNDQLGYRFADVVRELTAFIATHPGPSAELCKELDGEFGHMLGQDLPPNFAIFLRRTCTEIAEKST